MSRGASHRDRRIDTGRTEKAVLWCDSCRAPKPHQFDCKTNVVGYSSDRDTHEIKKGVIYQRLIFVCDCGARRDWGNEVA